MQGKADRAEMTEMKKKEIQKKIRELVCMYAPAQKTEAKDADQSFLTGKDWGFGAREMVYLHFAVEKEFQIEIEAADMADDQFATISNIAQVVERKLSKSGIYSICE